MRRLGFILFLIASYSFFASFYGDVKPQGYLNREVPIASLWINRTDILKVRLDSDANVEQLLNFQILSENPGYYDALTAIIDGSIVILGELVVLFLILY